MSKHLFGLVITSFGTAANNRGESEGNLTTLQKLVWKGQVHTTVSAEAIRSAIRSSWQETGQEVNRRWDEERHMHTWSDQEFAQQGKPYIDDDVLGFMSARAAKAEGEETPEAATAGAKRGRARGTIDARRARLELTRAISLTPWAGDIVFNAASPGATPAASSTGRDPVPYGAEIHATRFQYGFALTPDALYERSRAGLALDAIAGLAEVAGNQARFLYDFSPATLILRWTDDPAPRFLHTFEADDDDIPRVPRLLRLVRTGDVRADELWVGGELSDTDDGRDLAGLGANVFASLTESIRGAKAAMGL